MKKIYTLFLFAAFSFTHLHAQQALRRFMQPSSVINKIAYGNNSAAGHYVKSDDAKIYYEVYGKGQPIVLLHGGLFGSTIEMSNFIDSISKNFQVIAISTRGHGKSDIGSTPLTLEQRAKDVLNVINQVTKEKVILLGFSDGGYTSYKFGSMYPDRVIKMIVIGAGIVYPGLRDFNFNITQAINLDTAYWKQQRTLMPEPIRLEEVFQKIRNCYNQLTVSKDLLGAIKCPVLVMAGDRDEVNTVQNVLNAALLIPNHQIAIISNAGHPAFIDNFTAAWACISPFLKE
jgi:pimeloyl-ACP methyl ester carboxylesterase